MSAFTTAVRYYAPSMVGALSNVQSIHPSVCPMILAQQQCILRLWLLENTNRKPHAGSK